MNDNIQKSIINDLAKVCDAAYELEQSLYPKFIQEHWNDQVRIASLSQVGELSAEEKNVARILRGKKSAEEWAQYVLTVNASIVAARVKLTTVYNQARETILAADSEEVLYGTIQALYEPAKSAALEIGSTSANDKRILELVESWYRNSLELIMPTELEDDKEE